MSFCVPVPVNENTPIGTYRFSSVAKYDGTTWSFDSAYLGNNEEKPVMKYCELTPEQLERADAEGQLRMFESSVEYITIIILFFILGIILGWILKGRTDATEHC